MDKNEYKVKLDEIKHLVAHGKYPEAADQADQINWKKVRNVNTLYMIANIYEKMEDYEKCREILLLAYHHSPIGRSIISKLTQVAVKMKNVDEAVEYFNEFVEIAPHDTMRYELEYKICVLRKEPLDKRIEILEQLKDIEYTEKWSYELAVLYHLSGKRRKCVETCDDLVVWFGEGEYVKRALDLKRQYQPLTPEQEELYASMEGEKIPVEIPTSDVADSDAVEVIKELQRTGKLPDLSNTSKFNTVNLQEEIAKNIQQIMEAEEQGAVEDSMDNLKKIVTDIPYLQPEEPSAEEDNADAELEEAINEKLSDSIKEEPAPAKTSEDVNIEDVLADWEKTKVAAEAALVEAEQQKFAHEKQKALQEASAIMDRLNALLPLLSAYDDSLNIDNTEAAKLEAPTEEEKAASAMVITSPLSVTTELEDALLKDALSDAGAVAAEGAKEAADNNHIWNGRLTKSQKEMFSYFLPVPGMEEQILAAIRGTVGRYGTTPNSASGNIIIQGEAGSGKTVLSTSVIKAIQQITKTTDKKIGKVSADTLNKKDFAQLIPRLEGGFLIIDKAGDLKAETAAHMSEVMDGETQGLMVILEDNKAGIRNAMGLDYNFSKKFTEKITIPIFTIDELVEFGKSYATEMECNIDDMGVLALYNRINSVQKVDHPTTLAEVKDIVDAAIESAEGSGLKGLFAKKYDDSDYLILREKDFAL